MTYNWQQPDWPNFHFDQKSVEELLYELSEKVGYLHGLVIGLSEKERQDFLLDLMVTEALHTSSIEGEHLGREDIKSSIRNQLGLNQTPELVKDQRAKSISELMVLVREESTKPLTEEMLLMWHSKLFQADRFIHPGQWRTHQEPMQVISGAYGKPRIHFEAPPSKQVPREMKRYITWFNKVMPTSKGKPTHQPPILSAIAHIYFESIHPFEDGNGRIGRALSEKMLAIGWGNPVFISLSRAIESNRRAYYEHLEHGQKSNEITEWVKYFLGMLLTAQQDAKDLALFSIKKMQFFDKYKKDLNDRHLKVIRRMMSEGPKGFEGGMNARKYVGITKVSKATATRDLQYLSEIGVFSVVSAGRLTYYTLNL